MELLRWERGVLICVDSQAAILAATGNKPEPGHYILDWFHRQQEALTKKHDHMAMLMRWAPGHHDIEGNEAADEAVKGDTTPNDRLPKFLRERMPHRRSALRQAVHAKLKTMETNL